MNPFRYVKATSPADALARMGQNPGARFVAGGTTLLDLMKLGVETPGVLIDIAQPAAATKGGYPVAARI